MTKTALIKDVAVGELLHLREQGMTNAQIAQKVGVTSRTIINHIGPQPKELRKKPGPKAKSLPPYLSFIGSFIGCVTYRYFKNLISLLSTFYIIFLFLGNIGNLVTIEGISQ